MSLEALIGQQKTSPSIQLDGGAIAKFVKGIAETDPRYTDPSHSRHVAPPLVVATSIIPGTGAMLMDLGLGAKLMRIVHGSIEIRFDRMLGPGDTLSCTAEYLGTEAKGSGEVLSFDFDITDGNGDSVSTGTTRYFVRGQSKGSGKSAAQNRDLEAPDAEVVDVVPAGQSLLYADGSGDRFPIHTDENFAQSVGLPSVILHGMCTLAFATRAVVTSVAGGEPEGLQGVAVRFTGMVFHGDTLTHRIWHTTEGARFVTLNQDGRVVLDDGRAMIRKAPVTDHG